MFALATPSTGPWTPALGAGLIVAAAVSAFLTVSRRARREAVLLPEDNRFFRSQDVRRGLCSALLALIGVLILVSIRFERPANRADARIWISLWLVVLALLITVLILAGLDWAANARYALRHRRALLSEQRELLADMARARQKEASSPPTRRGPPFHDPSLN